MKSSDELGSYQILLVLRLYMSLLMQDFLRKCESARSYTSQISGTKSLMRPINLLIESFGRVNSTHSFEILSVLVAYSFLLMYFT